MIKLERRNEIKEIVLQTLLHSNLPHLPVNIKKICKSFEYIRVIPFSVQMKHRNMTFDEVYKQCESEDACADFYAKSGKYIIYYNDVTKWKYVTSNRYRWSLAHELGHILLKHHIQYNKTRIFRCALSDEEYNYLEEEADYFAQLILVPHAALLGFRVDSPRNIRIMCKISESAAKRRYYQYMEWKRHVDAQDEYDRRIFYFYFDFIFKRQCKNCGASLVQRHGKYCPICGEKNTLQWGDGKMIYPKLDSYENGKIKICPVCQNEETNIEGTYCQICGHTLANYCTNYDCSNGNELPTNARYCPICGSASTFFNAGYLKKWNYKDTLEDLFLDTNNDDEIDEELPFA